MDGSGTSMYVMSKSHKPQPNAVLLFLAGGVRGCFSMLHAWNFTEVVGPEVLGDLSVCRHLRKASDPVGALSSAEWTSTLPCEPPQRSRSRQMIFWQESGYISEATS